MGKIYTVGYGILKGTHYERHELFSKRLRYIYKEIGKHLAVIDIRRAGSGSINGEWFQQGECPERWLDFPFAMWRLVETCGMVAPKEFKYFAEPDLANHWGSIQKALKAYAHRLEQAMGLTPREQFEKVWEAFKKNGACLEDAFKAAGITVEPPSILPGVTGGEWDSKQRNLANRRDKEFPCEVWGYSKEGIKITTGWIRELRDAEVMAGSKKLAELNIKWLLKDRGTFKNMSPELQELVNHLAEMGADVTEIVK